MEALSRRSSLSPRKIKSKSTDPDDWKVYKKKAEDFFQAARICIHSENWNGAGLAAVHLAISATDALLAYLAKIRGASESHHDVYYLLKQNCRHPQIDHYAMSLHELLASKNAIEYQARSFPEPEAKQIFKKAERYWEWAVSQLPKGSS